MDHVCRRRLVRGNKGMSENTYKMWGQNSNPGEAREEQGVVKEKAEYMFEIFLDHRGTCGT